MKCVDVENILDDFVSGEFDFVERQKIEFHLEECPFCRNEAEELQMTNRLLRNLPIVKPSNQFDARMMQAFRTHQESKNKTSFWTAVFANFSISKPALAFALLALAGVSILAFQLGRMTSPIPETANIQTKPDENNPPVQIVEKRIEMPIIKTVEVTVYKEKIVNRVVYKNREIDRTIKVSKDNEIRENNFDSQSTAVTFVQNSNETFTPINLKNFQPVSEIKMDIIKGKNNEK